MSDEVRVAVQDLVNGVEVGDVDASLPDDE
jgi:hypothetical protein